LDEGILMMRPFILYKKKVRNCTGAAAGLQTESPGGAVGTPATAREATVYIVQEKSSTFQNS
jgi:hypothetical protein